MADVAALETFVAVARLGSVLRAAERLGRTQPSLSARLAVLEAAWKTKLFRRHARGMTLTPEGAELLGLAEAALASLQAVDRAAGAGTGAVADQELRVGSGDALGREVLPRALAILKRERPGLAVRVLEGPALRLVEALRGGEVDVALLTGAGENRGVFHQPLLTSRIDLLAPARAPARTAATPAGLAGEPIIALQRGSGFRRHLEVAFAAAGAPFRPAIEVGNLSLVRRFVAAGLGVAPVPSVAFPRRGRTAGTTQRPMRGIDPIAYTFATRAGVPPSSATRRLIELVRLN